MKSKADEKNRNRQDAKDAKRTEEILEDLADPKAMEDRHVKMPYGPHHSCRCAGCHQAHVWWRHEACC